MKNLQVRLSGEIYRKLKKIARRYQIIIAYGRRIKSARFAKR